MNTAASALVMVYAAAIGTIVGSVEMLAVALSPALLGDAAFESAGASPCDMTIEFVVPGDWRCHEEAPCTVCRNSSDHDSDLVARCVGEETHERYQIPAGAQLQICRGGSGVRWESADIRRPGESSGNS